MKQKRALNAAIAAESPESVITPSWEWPWWRTTVRHAPVFFWIVAIHVTAAVGLILFPLPGWRILLGAVALAWIGGLGTTICYHRALAHRALKLNRWASAILTFFAVFNGSGVPISWVVRHRLHHAKADTVEDISSPVYHGFWWAHLRWLWQTDAPPVERYCRDLDLRTLRVWDFLEGPIVALSLFSGLYFGACAFFWLGAIRLVFALHAQCFVNSICHTEPGIVPGEDSSRNVRWLALMHFFQGENWHRNHHSRPGLARLGWTWRQPDVGYLMIRLLERIGAASEVRDLKPV
jgi:fatty-acid desaturase